MATKRNYDLEMNKIIEKNRQQKEKPSLLLHACCAPCSSAVLERIAEDFDLTVFFYNPNIAPEAEFQKRSAELKRLLSALPQAAAVKMVCPSYAPEAFYGAVRGLEKIPEGGERCFACYRLRLEETAKYAAAHHFALFTTTLTISPLKNAAKLNEIGEALAQQYGVSFLPSDFKKKDGYKRSIQLSHQYDLYRQDFCGCIFSKQERDERARCAAKATEESFCTKKNPQR